MSIADLRKDYQQASLTETDVNVDPFEQFGTWFEEALKADVAEANAMSLSTVNAEGRPSSRIVLIKEFDHRGFCWFTNYDSAKGQDIATNPYAALLFFWTALERQVRIEGKIEKITAEENDAYFHSRPLGSRQGAHASHQSQPIANRAALEEQLVAVLENSVINHHVPNTGEDTVWFQKKLSSGKAVVRDCMIASSLPVMPIKAGQLHGCNHKHCCNPY